MPKSIILYIHGKGGTAKEAEHYKSLLPNYAITALDYKGNTPWQNKEEFAAAYNEIARQTSHIILIANSIGAYFAINALSQKKIKSAFFISPVIDMLKLITDMMIVADITQQKLKEKKEIKTPFGETLSWQYFCYAKQNQIVWNIPTHILYGAKDNLTSFESISLFAEKTKASLTVMPEGEHWFHTKKQMAFLDNWLKQFL